MGGGIAAHLQLAQAVGKNSGIALSDEQWGDYLFMRKNPKGVHFERWVHSRGCRQWFNVARHTVTHEIIKVYKMGEPAPKLEQK